MNINTVSSLIAAQLYRETHTPGATGGVDSTLAESQPESARRRQGSLAAFTMAGAMALALSGCDDSSQSPGTYIAPPPGLRTRDAALVGSPDGTTTNAYVHPVYSGGGGYWTSRGYYPVYSQPGYYYRPTPGSTVQMMTVSESLGEGGGIVRGGFGGGEGGEGGHGGGGE